MCNGVIEKQAVSDVVKVKTTFVSEVVGDVDGRFKW
jgi:hypothetical protein